MKAGTVGLLRTDCQTVLKWFKVKTSINSWEKSLEVSFKKLKVLTDLTVTVSIEPQDDQKDQILDSIRTDEEI